MKRFFLIWILAVIALGSCSKEEDTLEEYIGVFAKEFIIELSLDTSELELAKEQVKEIMKQILEEHGIESNRQITLYHFGDHLFVFHTTFTNEDLQVLGQDSRFSSISKNHEISLM